MLGSVLGNYQIQRELGRGGMGVVYAGVHRLLGRTAAIKVLQPKYSQDAEIVQRFFNEARAAAAIKHPGIVEIYDYGHAGGSAYIVMELCEGESLAQRMREQPDMPIAKALAIARHIAGALGAAHDAGIVHRDLKPDNVFLVADRDVAGAERIKLLDFGIAKLVTGAGPSQTTTGVIMGTPNYMSPEQCRGAGEVDHRSDLYALGCMVFELVCGRVPFVGAGSGDVIGAHLLTAPPRPTTLAPDLPADVEELILALLAKAPDDRPQTASAVAEAIERIASGLSPVLAASSRVALAHAPTLPSDRLREPGAPKQLRETALESQPPVPPRRAPRPAPPPPPPKSRRSPWVVIAAAGAAAAIAGVVVVTRDDPASDAVAARDAGPAVDAAPIDTSPRIVIGNIQNTTVKTQLVTAVLRSEIEVALRRAEPRIRPVTTATPGDEAAGRQRRVIGLDLVLGRVSFVGSELVECEVTYELTWFPERTPFESIKNRGIANRRDLKLDGERGPLECARSAFEHAKGYLLTIARDRLGLGPLPVQVADARTRVKNELADLERERRMYHDQMERVRGRVDTEEVRQERARLHEVDAGLAARELVARARDSFVSGELQTAQIAFERLILARECKQARYMAANMRTRAVDIADPYVERASDCIALPAPPAPN